jgi:hypothetical protein
MPRAEGSHMTILARLGNEALTLEQYRQLDLTRPYTDPPLGADHTRRSYNEAASAVFHEEGIAQPGWTKPSRKNPIDL